LVRTSGGVEPELAADRFFDVAMNYADVIPLKEAIDYIRGLPENLFAPALW